MALDDAHRVETIKTLDDYMAKVRPTPDLRDQLDLSYEIVGQSVLLNEIRPVWRRPGETMRIGYAKATYVKSRDLWKVYWKRADLKWHPYPPTPTVGTLRAFLKLVDQDACGCFKG